MIAVQTMINTLYTTNMEGSRLLAATDLVMGLLGVSVICELCWTIRAPTIL